MATATARKPSAPKPLPTLYSYEGTYQMQNLIVGKEITGLSAYV